MIEQEPPLGLTIRTPSERTALLALLEADLVVQLSNARAWLLAVVFPLVLLFAFYGRQRGSGLGDQLFPLSTAIIGGAASLALIGYPLRVAIDRERGVFQRLRVTPVPTWAIMTSRLLVQFVFIIAMSAVVLTAASIFANVTLVLESYALTLIAVILSAAVFLSIGQALVGLLHSPDLVNAAGRVTFVGVFALSVFGQSDILGGNLTGLAQWSPAGEVATVLTASMRGTTWSSDIWWAFFAATAYAVLFGAVGVSGFRWSIR